MSDITYSDQFVTALITGDCATAPLCLNAHETAVNNFFSFFGRDQSFLHLGAFGLTHSLTAQGQSCISLSSDPVAAFIVGTTPHEKTTESERQNNSSPFTLCTLVLNEVRALCEAAINDNSNDFISNDTKAEKFADTMISTTNDNRENFNATSSTQTSPQSVPFISSAIEPIPQQSGAQAEQICNGNELSLCSPHPQTIYPKVSFPASLSRLDELIHKGFSSVSSCVGQYTPLVGTFASVWYIALACRHSAAGSPQDAAYADIAHSQILITCFCLCCSITIISIISF